MDNDVETFFPYNQLKGHTLVNFIELKKTEQGMFSDIMVVEYKGEEYELLWDEHYSYYTGKVNGEKGYVL